ncbi:MAG: 50S ribosomal protein L18 [Candidatus Rokuibacteriota bacterium]|jgi:large subunit ribosomal protein L18|nr:MAG: 50S ribosomal protein L18 [Candidatus Rokubacteria bacterium]
MIITDKRGPRDKRHYRLRRWVRGTTGKPRLAVFRSLNHIYAQLVDDETGRTLAAADSRSKEFRTANPKGGNVAAAKAVGTLLAQRAKAAGVQTVVFDRGGYKYHGRVKALADAARAGGLAF